MATIKDVAKLAGVAVSTASYALNNSKRISTATKERVEEAARQLNYKKNGIASDLKRTKTNTIALILSDLSGPYYSELIKGVQDVTTANGFDLIACSSIGDQQSTAVKFLKEKRVDGAIILAHNISDAITIESAQAGFPVIVLDRDLIDENVYHVEVDNTEGGFIATECLIKHGHENIAYIGGPSASLDNQKRFDGYKQALEQYQLPSHSKWNSIGYFTKEGGYKATKLLIAQGELPDAIFYGNDEMAIGGLQAFQEKNIRIPEDISIIGFDDIQLAEYVHPPLTTIKQPKYEVGALAVHLIFQLLEGKNINSHYKLSTELIERKSVMLKKQ
ncbi:LacI family transcriptional regulator [Gracilibacillus caseinilyticus]|uniref:LacI family transcriptional regulator n=1 Tax=Gracilibacillus caseinilyticus TaxID=2932256 RepID=A0ABY4ESG6_9BACI|nr:LacI family DNA-binding transcriptional regulator [Gracilibacillus caseinilyticus]UOQ47128.1 LacI family transcriptional regulator [Gracilibacillus caseinilyticus]